MHWPAGLTEPCSLYCQRETTGGRQQEPADALHGTGAGRAAAAVVADRVMSCAGAAQAGAAAMADVVRIVPASSTSARAPRILTSSADVHVAGGRGGWAPPRKAPGVHARHQPERIITMIGGMTPGACR